MTWGDRFQDYLVKERYDLKIRIVRLTSRHLEMWETTEGARRDVTDDYAAHLQTRLAEIEQMIVEEGLS